MSKVIYSLMNGRKGEEQEREGRRERERGRREREEKDGEGIR